MLEKGALKLANLYWRLACRLLFSFWSEARSETILDLEPTNVNANRIDMAMVTSKKRQGE